MAENESEKDRPKQISPYRGAIELMQVGSLVLIPIGWVLRSNLLLWAIAWYFAIVLAALPFFLARRWGKKVEAEKARVKAAESAQAEAAPRSVEPMGPRRGVEMRPYHSRKESEVYHIFFDCTHGNNIEPENRVEGTGDKKLCETCEEMLKEKAA